MELFTESENREIKLPDDMLPDRSQNLIRNHIGFTKPLQLTEKTKRGQDKDHHEKLVGSLAETTSKVIESTGHAVKVSTTGIDNMFHGILGGVGGRMQWFLIFAIILVLLCINCSTLLKICRRKPSGPSNVPTTPFPTPPTHSVRTRNRLVSPTSTHEQSPTLPLVLTSFTLRDVSTSQEKSGIVLPLAIQFQHDHISCSAFFDIGSEGTLLSEKIQLQLDLPIMPLESHYHLLGATGDTLNTLETV